MERFQALDIRGIDFEDAAIGTYDSDPIPTVDIKEVEAEVRSLVTGRFNQSQIDRIDSMLDPDNRDFFQVNKSQLTRFKNTPVPPPPPLRSLAPTFPTATVITVTLNDAEKLEKTICSVLEQTYPHIEYIIIDGGSTDSTPDLLKKYEGKIHRVVSEPDNGIFDAMNKGIDLATGTWIIFLNAGDYFYEKNTVEKVFITAYGDAHFIYGHTYFLGGDFRGVVKAWSFASLWKTMIFTHQSLFTRSEVLKKRKFDTSFKICADYHLIFNSYMEGLRFFNSDIVIAAFDPGFSEVSRSRMAFEKWKVVKKYRNDLKFHWFYFKLFIKRFFRDITRRARKKVGQ
jgi:glycosyltransferase involved in cell wall biosynthesis